MDRTLEKIRQLSPSRRRYEAVRNLHDTFQRTLVAHAGRYAESSAADVVQDVFIKLLTMKEEKFSAIENLEAYAITMTKRQAIRANHKDNRYIAFPDGKAGVEPQAPSREEEPWLKEQVEYVLRRLTPKRYEQVLRLHLQEYPHEDIREWLNLRSVGLSKTTLHRAKIKFAELYRKLYGDPDDDPKGGGGNGSGTGRSGGGGHTPGGPGRPKNTGKNGKDTRMADERSELLDLLRLLAGELPPARAWEVEEAMADTFEAPSLIGGAARLLCDHGTPERAIAYLDRQAEAGRARLEEYINKLEEENVFLIPEETDELTENHLFSLELYIYLLPVRENIPFNRLPGAGNGSKYKINCRSVLENCHSLVFFDNRKYTIGEIHPLLREDGEKDLENQLTFKIKSIFRRSPIEIYSKGGKVPIVCHPDQSENRRFEREFKDDLPLCFNLPMLPDLERILDIPCEQADDIIQNGIDRICLRIDFHHLKKETLLCFLSEFARSFSVIYSDPKSEPNVSLVIKNESNGRYALIGLPHSANNLKSDHQPVLRLSLREDAFEQNLIALFRQTLVDLSLSDLDEITAAGRPAHVWRSLPGAPPRVSVEEGQLRLTFAMR